MWNSADADFGQSRSQTNMAGNSNTFRQFDPPNQSADQLPTPGLTWQEWYRRQFLPIPNGYSSQSSPLQNGYSNQSSLLQNGYPSQSLHLQNGYSNQSLHLQNGYSNQSSHSQNGYSNQSSLLQNGYSNQSSHLQNGFSGQSSHLQNGYPSQSSHLPNGFSGQSSHLQNGFSGQSSHLQNGYPSQSSHLPNGFSGQSSHLQTGCSSQSLPLQNGYSNQSSPLQNRYQNRSSSTPGRYQNPSSSASDRYQAQINQSLPLPNTAKPKLFVGHLPDKFTTEELIELFERIGHVIEADVINKYGFVHFRRLEDAEMAISVLNNHNIKGSCISVEFSRSLLHATPGTPGRSRGGASGGSSQPNRNRIHGEVQQSGSQQPRTFQKPSVRGTAHMNHPQGMPTKESATLPSRFSSMVLSSNGENSAVSQQHRNDRNYGGNSFYLSAPQSFTSGQPLIRNPAQTNNFRGGAPLQGNFSGMVPSQNWDIYRDEAANVFD